MQSKRFFLRILGILSLLLSSPVSIGAASPSSGGNITQIIAALTYNFAKYTTWPASLNTAPSLCYFDAAYEPAFKRLEGKPVHDAPLIIKQISSVTQAEACHLLYLSDNDKERMKRLMLALAGKPVLTISTLPGFLAQGGMIELFQENNKFRFDVDNQQLKRVELKLSAQVLKLARSVR
jgi:hypothetical protein